MVMTHRAPGFLTSKHRSVRRVGERDHQCSLYFQLGIIFVRSPDITAMKLAFAADRTESVRDEAAEMLAAADFAIALVPFAISDTAV
jgi:hypothetical protein